MTDLAASLSRQYQHNRSLDLSLVAKRSEKSPNIVTCSINSAALHDIANLSTSVINNYFIA